MKETTKRVLKQLMTDNLAKLFNYVGHGCKHAFSALLLKDIVTGKNCSAILTFSSDVLPRVAIGLLFCRGLNLPV